MKTLLFEISEQEKERILNSHIKATKNLYLLERHEEVCFTRDRPCNQGYFLTDTPEKGISAAAQKKGEKKIKEEKFDKFKKDNPDIKDLNFDTFVKMTDDAERVTNWNKNVWYDKTFDQNNNLNDYGKQYSRDIPNWYRYYRKIFGKKEINVRDVYNHWKSNGGLKKFLDVNKNEYDLSSPQ